MESIGQSNSIYIYTKKEVWGSFTVVQKTNLDKQSAPCVMDPTYSYTRCMLNHLATTAGCYLDWVNPGAVSVSNSDPLLYILSSKRYVMYDNIRCSNWWSQRLCDMGPGSPIPWSPEHSEKTLLDSDGQCYRLPCQVQLQRVQVWKGLQHYETISTMHALKSAFYLSRLVRRRCTGRHYHHLHFSCMQREPWWRLRRNYWYLTLRI